MLQMHPSTVLVSATTSFPGWFHMSQSLTPTERNYSEIEKGLA